MRAHVLVVLLALTAAAAAGAGPDVRDCADNAFAASTDWRCAHRWLSRADGTVDAREVAMALARLRAAGPAAAAAARSVAALLEHRSPLYRNRDKGQVGRLRALLMLTLGDLGQAQLALPTLHDVLSHLDERGHPEEVAAAARTAGLLGHRGRELMPQLVSLLSLQMADEQIAFESEPSERQRAIATTPRLEALRALRALCQRGDGALLAQVQIASAVGRGSDPRALQALADLAQWLREGSP